MARDIIDRLNKLGLPTSKLSKDKLESAVAALMCLPMYMVSNVHGWTEDRQFMLPVLEAHGAEAFREAKAIGSVEASLELDAVHAKALSEFLASARPSDLIVYEYALETLRNYLDLCEPTLASEIRQHVAQTIVHVAEASGKALFGGGEKVSHEERDCIAQIDEVLWLRKDPGAAAALEKISVG